MTPGLRVHRAARVLRLAYMPLRLQFGVSGSRSSFDFRVFGIRGVRKVGASPMVLASALGAFFSFFFLFFCFIFTAAGLILEMKFAPNMHLTWARVIQQVVFDGVNSGL